MDRPEKIYLEQPITINGYKIGCTREGLVYLIDHFTQCLAIAKPHQITQADRDFASQRIEELKFHLIQYDSQPPATV